MQTHVGFDQKRDSLMMVCDIDETVTRKLKERFTREPVEVRQR